MKKPTLVCYCHENDKDDHEFSCRVGVIIRRLKDELEHSRLAHEETLKRANKRGQKALKVVKELREQLKEEIKHTNNYIEFLHKSEDDGKRIMKSLLKLIQAEDQEVLGYCPNCPCPSCFRINGI